MNEFTASPEFEAKVRRAAAVAGPDPVFVNRLRGELIARANIAPPPRRSSLQPVWVWMIAGMALIIAGVLIVGPQNVASAMRRLLGYIPGIGVVNQDVPIRALAEPTAVTRAGITLTVEQAVLDSERTVILFKVDGIPHSAYPGREDASFCHESPQVRLPDGALLQITGGEGGGWGSGYRSRDVFPPIPADVNEATFVLPCLQDAAPGAVPENWELPLRFAPAPPDLTVMPVIEMSTPLPTEMLTVPAATPVTESAFGIRLSLDRVIQVGDAYVLIGSVNSENERFDASGAVSRIVDSIGQGIAFMPADSSDLSLPPLASNQWAVKVSGRYFHAPLTLVMDGVGVTLKEPVSFQFDPGPNPQEGQEWPINQELQVLGYRVRVLSAHYLVQGELHGFEFTFQLDPALKSLDWGIVRGIEGGTSGGGGGGPVGENGLMRTYALTNGRFNSPLTLGSSSAQLAGRWQTSWDPPITDITPTPMPQGCLTLDQWKQVAAHPMSFPQNLAGKVVVYGRIKDDGNAPSPNNYGIFVANWDGNNKQVLGQGTWPALAPDGAKAAYSAPDGLHVVNLASGEDRILSGTTTNDYAPRWSPDERQLAFVRTDDVNLYVVSADGSGLRRVTRGVEYEQLLGWSADGMKLYYTVPEDGGQQQLRSIDLATGTVQDGFAFNSKGASAALAPDGQWIAFVARVPGMIESGLYLAHLDGSDRRLLAHLDNWGISDPVWSPDGKWLIVTITNTDEFLSVPRPALIDPETCQAIPLVGIEGYVQGWAP